MRAECAAHDVVSCEILSAATCRSAQEKRSVIKGRRGWLGLPPRDRLESETGIQLSVIIPGVSIVKF